MRPIHPPPDFSPKIPSSGKVVPHNSSGVLSPSNGNFSRQLSGAANYVECGGVEKNWGNGRVVSDLTSLFEQKNASQVQSVSSRPWDEIRKEVWRENYDPDNTTIYRFEERDAPRTPDKRLFRDSKIPRVSRLTNFFEEKIASEAQLVSSKPCAALRKEVPGAGAVRLTGPETPILPPKTVTNEKPTQELRTNQAETLPSYPSYYPSLSNEHAINASGYSLPRDLIREGSISLRRTSMPKSTVTPPSPPLREARAESVQIDPSLPKSSPPILAAARKQEPDPNSTGLKSADLLLQLIKKNPALGSSPENTSPEIEDLRSPGLVPNAMKKMQQEPVEQHAEEESLEKIRLDRERLHGFPASKAVFTEPSPVISKLEQAELILKEKEKSIDTLRENFGAVSGEYQELVKEFNAVSDKYAKLAKESNESNRDYQRVVNANRDYQRMVNAYITQIEKFIYPLIEDNRQYTEDAVLFNSTVVANRHLEVLEKCRKKFSSCLNEITKLNIQAEKAIILTLKRANSDSDSGVSFDGESPVSPVFIKQESDPKTGIFFDDRF